MLSARGEKQLAELIAAPAADPELHGLAPLVWYHSHIHRAGERAGEAERALSASLGSHFSSTPAKVAGWTGFET